VDFIAERGICLIWTLDFVNFGGFRGFRLLAGPGPYCSLDQKWLLISLR